MQKGILGATCDARDSSLEEDRPGHATETSPIQEVTMAQESAHESF